MPCLCHYEPPEEEKRHVKYLCGEVVRIVKEAEKLGDPIGLGIDDIHTLIDHLYDQNNCKENYGKKEIN